MVDGRLRGVGFLGLGQIGQAGDGGAGVEDGAGPDVGLPRLQVGLARLAQGRLEDVGALLQLANGLAKTALADLMAADDKGGRCVQAERLEERQGGDQRGGVDQAAAPGGQAQGRGGADAAKGPDQPQSDASLTHEDLSNAGVRFDSLAPRAGEGSFLRRSD